MSTDHKHDEDPLISLPRAARTVGVTPATLADWSDKGTEGFPAAYRLPHGRRVYRQSEVLDWLESRRFRQPGPSEPE